MRGFLKFVFALVVVGILAIAAIILIPVQRTGPLENLPANYKPLADEGKYVARMADCAACHTASDGKPFAGGREVDSPFGIIYSSNITPSQDGIGGWTLDQFRDALRDGISADGSHLYPAMPYENYRKINERDMVALYDYFMNEVQPVDEKVKATNLTFPFNQRWGIRLWNWAALRGEPSFRPRYKDDKLDRGAYLVESLGHCGACHTPRDFLFRQSGLDGSLPEFLTGETVSGWYAPDLTGRVSSLRNWSEEDIKLYLSTGRNNHSSAIGPMQLVAGDSMQYASNEDLDAVASYLKSLAARQPLAGKPDSEKNPRLTTNLLTQAAPDMALGPRLYLDNCNACHFANGKGAPQVFPELDGAKIVTAKDPSGLIQTILNGARLPSTKLRTADLAMPGFGWRLKDDEVVELVNFLRQGWTNDAPPIIASDVAKIRANPLKD